MPAKKMKKTDGGDPDVPVLDLKAVSNENLAFLNVISDAMNVIKDKWPNIEEMDPLPEIGDNHELKMCGYMAPFNPQSYNEKRKSTENLEYTAGINFFWQNILQSVMPWVPEILEQVQAFSDTITPGLLKHSIILNATFKDGDNIPRGNILRISPDEYPHAVVLKLAKVIELARRMQILCLTCECC